jgi:hypothetical protein
MKGNKTMLASERFSIPELAFERAIETKRLSDDEYSDNYAGDYMYMGKDKNGNDAFKNIDTRKYIK